MAKYVQQYTKRSDITVQYRKSKTCVLIEVPFPFDKNINEVEEIELERYQALQWELKKTWNYKSAKILAIIDGALGTANAMLRE